MRKKIKDRIKICFVLLTAFCLNTSAADKPFYNEIVNNAAFSAKNGGCGENFAWRASFALNEWLPAYYASRDKAWLDSAVKAFDFLLSLRMAGPDGYKGWVGGEAEFWEDSNVGDAILYAHMLDFAEVVLKDKALKEIYGTAAEKYISIFKKDYFEKWNTRGAWHEDGPYAAYSVWDYFCKKGDTATWKKYPNPDANPLLSLPFNKQGDAGVCFLKLYRISGETVYRERAQKIFSFLKSRIQLAGDYYVWNYWEAFGPWDVDTDKQLTRLWMSVHPYRNYQSGEIHQIVEAYNTGVVFDKKDIERILNTNLKTMWNGDRVSAKFINSNSKLPANPVTPEEKKAAEERAKTNVYSKGGTQFAGCLWEALCPFDQTIRDIYAAQLKNGRGGYAKDYFEKVTQKTPPSFARKYADLPVTVFERPFSSVQSLTVAAVMPHSVSKSKPSVVLCKARRDVDLEITVYSADGKEKKGVLFNGKLAGGTDGLVGIKAFNWDGTINGTELDKGSYRVRWTVSDGYREFPVEITE